MSFSVPAVSLAVALAAAFGFAGCGKTVIDDVKTEGAIEHDLQASAGQKVRSVDCPSGVEVKAGNTFECTIQLAGGESETATLKIRNSDADIELTRLAPEKGGGSGAGSSAEQRSSKGSK
jgi:hypothetical protein